MARTVAIGRKNCLFMSSDNRGKAAAVLYSIMASAKSNQVEPFAFVQDLLCQLSGCSPTAVATPLPDAWLAAHPDEAGAGRGSWSTEFCDTEKLILDGYSAFCLKT